MKTFKFKTNIHCEECLVKVASFLNTAKGIHDWKIDINHPDKVLSVIGAEVEPPTIEQAVTQAGYEAELLQVYGSGGNAL